MSNGLRKARPRPPRRSLYSSYSRYLFLCGQLYTAFIQAILLLKNQGQEMHQMGKRAGIEGFNQKLRAKQCPWDRSGRGQNRSELCV